MRPFFAPLLLLAYALPAAAQPDPPVRVPPIEIATGVSIDHSSAGAVISIGGNVTRTFAVVSELSTSGDGTAVLGGARVGTGFWYDGRPPMPGRFFGQVLAGRQHGDATTAGTIIQPGVGGDVIVLPHVGASLHWAVDYRWLRGAPSERSGARLVVGVLIGPHT